MKKFILLSFLGLLVMAFSASVYAMDFKASGFIDEQWFYNVNTTPANPAGGIYQAMNPNFYIPISPTTYTDPIVAYATRNARDRKANWYESRARLKFDAIMDKDLSGTIFFEMDSANWGDIPGGQSSKISERNTFGYWSADRAAVEIKNVYIDFGLPYVGIPVPMSFRVGLQPFSIRNNIFLYTDGMGIIWNTKIDPVAIQLMYAKPYEGRIWVSQDDVDVLGGHVTAKVGPVTAGGYYMYYNMNSYPFNSITNGTAAGYTASFDAHMWWAGLYMDGKLGPVNVNLDGIIDRGKVERRTSATTDWFVPDVKYRGWAARAKVDFPWEKFNFGLTGYYASGADASETSPSGLPGTTTGYGPYWSINAPYSTKVKSYVVPPGSESGAIFGESVVFYSFWANRGDSGIANTLNYNQVSRGPIGGTWMAKAYASVKALPWYKVTLQGMYIGDTTKNGDTFGNSATFVYPFFPTAPYGFYPQNSNDIGWELDLINEIDIYKNLKLVVAGGYMWAGGAMDRFTGNYFTFGYPIPINESIKNPWAITWNLTYNF
jgi:hypothetical protein